MAKILLVEDDKSLREIYGVRLQAEGYTIVSAGDGEEALALAIKERPDLILSDVMMPKISGFDMLDILRSTTETKDVKVIMMTALSSEDQRARGESLGANKYLVKSQVGIEDVVRAVREVLDGQTGSTSPSPQPVAQPQFSQPAPEETQPVPQQPFATQPVPVDTPTAPQATPQTQTAPTLTPEQQVSTGSPLPQPLAPFSSPAPASLGDQFAQAAPTQPISNPQPEPQPTFQQPAATPAPQTPQQNPQPVAQPQFSQPSELQQSSAPQPAPAEPQTVPQQPQPLEQPVAPQPQPAAMPTFAPAEPQLSQEPQPVAEAAPQPQPLENIEPKFELPKPPSQDLSGPAVNDINAQIAAELSQQSAPGPQNQSL